MTPAARALGAALLLAVAAAACSSGEQAPPGPQSQTQTSASAPVQDQTSASPPTQDQTSVSPPTQTQTQAAPDAPPTLDAAAAYAVVEQLAGSIGPREASGPAFRAAADLVAQRLVGLGYQVARPEFPVPAGVSWGVRVPAGQSQNVVATPPGFDPAAPHRLVGAHLDTVPQAPGAEDNASGIGVLLELARLAAAQPPPVPVVLVAFGAEEPRGTGEAWHHFGSMAYVASMPAGHRAALAGMVSLDRVGVPSDTLAVCHGGLAGTRVRTEVLDAAAAAGVPARPCVDRASDHYSFEQAGIPASRLGKVPFAGYHSPGDVPGVVDPAQLHRTGTVAWAWLSSRS